MNKPISKHSEKGALHYPSEGLTCSEGQVEDLLSGGESTETESEEESSPHKPPKSSSFQKKSSRPVPKKSDK